MDKSLPGQQLDTDIGALGTGAPPARRALQVALKVPEITIFFWIIKLLTTAMGESTSDFLVYTINPYVAVILGFIGFVIALALQLSVRRYIAWIYWLAVLMVAVFGTMAADVLHIVLKVPYIDSSILFAVVLAVVFLGWYAVERTLSIHSIYTLRRELFYWAAVVATFAMGTATGDLTAYTFGLGFFVSILLFAALFLLPGLGYGLFRLNAIFAFWFAYILTRPLGASFADWFGKSKSVTGLGIGDGPVAAVLGILIVVFVAYLTFTRKDVQDLAAIARD
ncbi:MAG TPA: hypothetical protein VKT52_12580 [Ktedonobacterales bacterium]|nr:hypothetical protein [Ktedonobacterales bacterium]